MHRRLLHTLPPDEVDVMIQCVEEAEVDAMWSYVGKKREPRWLWHAIDPCSGHVLAYVLGRRKDEGFLKLKALLEPCGITRYATDDWGGLHTSSRGGGAPAGQAQYAADRADTSDVTHPAQAVDAEDALLLHIAPDTRHCDRGVRQSL